MPSIQVVHGEGRIRPRKVLPIGAARTIRVRRDSQRRVEALCRHQIQAVAFFQFRSRFVPELEPGCERRAAVRALMAQRH